MYITPASGFTVARPGAVCLALALAVLTVGGAVVIGVAVYLTRRIFGSKCSFDRGLFLPQMLLEHAVVNRLLDL